MPKYILNPAIALRSWRLVPYAYYIKGMRDAKGLKKDEFDFLASCDGTKEIDGASPLAKNFHKWGLSRPQSKATRFPIGRSLCSATTGTSPLWNFA